MQNNIVCVFCPRMGMGDLISFISHFKAINEHTKKQLVIVTKKNTAGKHYLLNESYCKDVIYLPERKRGLINFYSNIKDFTKLVGLIKKINPKEVYILHSSKRYVLASLFAGTKNIYAPGLGFQNLFVKKDNSYYKNFFEKKLHPRLESEKLIKKIFCINTMPNNTFINKKKLNKNNHILISTACSGDSKQWGYENHFKIIQFLIKKKFNNFFILAGKRQSEMEKLLISNLNKNNVVIKGTSHLELIDIFEIISSAKFYFGHDTGFMHMVTSFEIPALIIYGDIPPFDYNKYMNSIKSDNDIYSMNSIKNISFDKVKNELEKFIIKYNFQPKSY